ncbi:MAG: hypothetical protein M1115_04495 [Actinobacteria bacterium]|nr:hypothetical protein [Actinomycetota bacterium]
MSGSGETQPVSSDTAPVSELAHQERLDAFEARAATLSYMQIEARLFEIVTPWAAIAPEPKAQIHFHTYGRYHAWHAELWSDLCTGPGSALAGADQLSGKSDRSGPWPDGQCPALDRVGLQHLRWLDGDLLERLAEPSHPSRTLEKLVGLYRVMIPRLVVAYRFHLERTVQLCDGPLQRVLNLVLQDEVAAWQEGEALVEEALDSGQAIERAIAWQASLEAVAVSSQQVTGS